MANTLSLGHIYLEIKHEGVYHVFMTWAPPAIEATPLAMSGNFLCISQALHDSWPITFYCPPWWGLCCCYDYLGVSQYPHCCVSMKIHIKEAPDSWSQSCYFQDCHTHTRMPFWPAELWSLMHLCGWRMVRRGSFRYLEAEALQHEMGPSHLCFILLNKWQSYTILPTQFSHKLS